MNYLLIVFSGRRDATAFYEILLSLGYNALIVNTPRALAMSCGISVRTTPNAIYAVRNVLANRDFASYVATYYYNNGRFIRT